MTVAPVPVLRLLLFARLRKFLSTLVILRMILPVGSVFVVVPGVVVLVAGVVDSNLNAGVLRSGRGHDRHWCGKRSSQE